MLDLGSRSRKAGTVTVPLLLPKQWLRLVHRLHFHSNKFHLYVSQKEKKLLTRFEEVAGTLTPRLMVALVFRGFVVALIVGKLVVTLKR